MKSCPWEREYVISGKNLANETNEQLVEWLEEMKEFADERYDDKMSKKCSPDVGNGPNANSGDQQKHQ
jgi:hypothetical protein